MHEILVKVGDNSSSDPENNKACYKDGDIIFITSPEKSRNAWKEMLERGRCTQEQYVKAQIKPGLFKWPWGKEEKRIHQVFVLDDVLNDVEIQELTGSEMVEIDKDPMGLPRMKMERRRNYRIDLNSVQILDGKKKVELPKNVISDIRNKNKTVEPMYDKPISKDEIRRRK